MISNNNFRESLELYEQRPHLACLIHDPDSGPWQSKWEEPIKNLARLIRLWLKPIDFPCTRDYLLFILKNILTIAKEKEFNQKALNEIINAIESQRAIYNHSLKQDSNRSTQETPNLLILELKEAIRDINNYDEKA